MVSTYDIPRIDTKSIQENVVATAVGPLVGEGVGLFHAPHVLPDSVSFADQGLQLDLAVLGNGGKHVRYYVLYFVRSLKSDASEKTRVPVSRVESYRVCRTAGF